MNGKNSGTVMTCDCDLSLPFGRIIKEDGEELTAEEQADIASYKEFAEYRNICANCAKAILSSLKD